MFTVTPHRAVHSRIPIININGQLFADLSWFEGGVHLLLILRRSPRHSVESHPLYTIGLSASDTDGAPPIRIARVPPSNTNHGALIPSCTWVSLYLLHLAESGPRVRRIYMPMNHSFLPLVRIDEFILSEFIRRRRLTDVEIVNAQLPWSRPAEQMSDLPHVEG